MSTNKQLEYLTKNYVGKLCTLIQNTVYLDTEDYTKEREHWKQETVIMKGTTVLIVKFVPRGTYRTYTYFNMWALNDTKLINFYGITYESIVRTDEHSWFKWL